jgi:Transcriptional regulators
MAQTKRKSVSQLEIARVAGVSRTTVSFVLNNVSGKNISEETRQRVVAVAKEFGYMPDESAVETATSREGAICLFVCHSESAFSDAYIMRLIEGMGPAIRKERYDLRVLQFRVSRHDYLETARRGGYDGALLLNTHADDPGVAELKASCLPFVVIGSLADPELSQVDIDNEEAAAGAARYLLSLGHRDVGVVAHAPETFLAVEARLRAFSQAMAEAGAPVPASRLRFARFTEESGYEAAAELLGSGPAPTAIFATNDVVAYGAIRAIGDAGLSIPDDISVVGFDDDYMSRYLDPPLTTVTLPAEGIGRTAAEVLLDKMRGGPGHAGLELLPTSLTLRRSCRKV